MTLHDIRFDEDRDAHEHCLECLKRDGKSNGERRHRVKNGQTIYVMVSCNSIAFEGHPAILSSIQDVTHLKTAEKERAEQRQRYTELFNHMQNGAAVYQAVNDGEDFIFADLNYAGELISQVRREDVLGRSILEMFPAARDIGLFDMLKEVWKTGKPQRLPSAFYQDDRLTIWVDNHVYKLPSGEVVAVYEDLTSQKVWEFELIENERRFREFAEQLLDVLYTTDLEGVITYVSPSSKKVFQRDPEEMTGHRIQEFLIEQDMTKALTAFREAIKTGRMNQVISVRLKKPDGSIFYAELNTSHLLEDGKIIGLQGLIRDVSERMEMAEKLRASEERFRLITENAIDLIYRMRLKPELSFEYVSPSVLAVTGYSADELYSDPQLYLKMTHPDDRRLLSALLTPGQKHPETVVFRWIRKDNKII